MNNFTNSQLHLLMHTGLSESDDDTETVISDINFEPNIFEEDFDEDLHFSQLQLSQVEEAGEDYGQNSIGWQQFIRNTKSSSKYVSRLQIFYIGNWIQK